MKSISNRQEGCGSALSEHRVKVSTPQECTKEIATTGQSREPLKDVVPGATHSRSNLILRVQGLEFIKIRYIN